MTLRSRIETLYHEQLTEFLACPEFRPPSGQSPAVRHSANGSGDAHRQRTHSPKPHTSHGSSSPPAGR